MGAEAEGTRGESTVPTVGRPASSGEDPFTHELRFLLTRSEAGRFLKALDGRAQVATYDPEHPISYTRTTYFDTADSAYLTSSVSEPARRLRVRQYAVAEAADEPPVFSGVGFIELKQHLGASRAKVRLAASADEIAALLKDPRAALAGADDALANDPRAIVARELAVPTMAPRLSTWYRRVHLITPDMPVRLTMDEGLLFCQPQPIGRAGLPGTPAPRDVVAAFPSRILEVKHAGILPAWLQQLLGGFRAAPTHFSKFRTGMEALVHEQEIWERPTVPRAPLPSARQTLTNTSTIVAA